MNPLFGELKEKIARFRLLHSFFHLRLHLNDPATNEPKAETAYGLYPPEVVAQVGYIEDIGLLWKEIDSLCQQIISQFEGLPSRPPGGAGWRSGLTAEHLVDQELLIRYLCSLLDDLA
jgi:hypothetical protein